VENNKWTKDCRNPSTIIAVEDRMFFRIQDFDFAEIQSNLPKSNHFCPNFSSILTKFRPNLTKFNHLLKQILLGDADKNTSLTYFKN